MDMFKRFFMNPAWVLHGKQITIIYNKLWFTRIREKKTKKKERPSSYSLIELAVNKELTV